MIKGLYYSSLFLQKSKRKEVVFMKAKRVIALLTALIVLTLSTFTVCAASFNDTEGHWADKDIERLKGFGIVNGDNGNVRPDDTINRAEFVTLTYNMLGGEDSDGATEYDYNQSTKGWNSYNVSSGKSAYDFSDFDGSKWYGKAMDWAVKNSVISGYDDSTVKAENPVTRQEAIVMLQRAFGISGEDKGISSNDSNSVAEWAKKAVGIFMTKGFINGDDNGNVNPNAHIKRCEAFKIISNMLGLYITQGGEFSGDYGDKIVVVNSGNAVFKNFKSGNLLIGVKAGEPEIDGNTMIKIKIFGNKKFKTKSQGGSGSGSSYIGGGSGGSSVSTKVTLKCLANGGYFKNEKEEFSGKFSQDSKLSRCLPDDPEREGYEFIGWYVTREKADIAARGGCVDTNSLLHKNTTLYAGWQISSNPAEFEETELEDKSEKPETELIEDYDVTEFDGEINISGKELKKYKYTEYGEKKYWIGFDVVLSGAYLDALKDENLRYYADIKARGYGGSIWTGYVAEDFDLSYDGRFTIMFDAEEPLHTFVLELPKRCDEKEAIYIVNIDKLKLHKYTEEEEEEDAKESEGVLFGETSQTTVFGKAVSDIVENLEFVINPKMLYSEILQGGTLKFVNDFPEEGDSGNYVVFDIILPKPYTDETAVVTVNGEPVSFTGSIIVAVEKVTEEKDDIIVTVDFDGEGTKFKPTAYTLKIGEDVVLGVGEVPEMASIPWK